MAINPNSTNLVLPHAEPLDSATDADAYFEKFLEDFKKSYEGNYVQDDLDKLRLAYIFAKEKHRGQIRSSGEPYITHPVAVASLLLNLNVDVASLIAAILHDVVEDTNTPIEDINKFFGDTVGSLVDGLTKISKIKFRSNQEKLAENFRKMVIAMAKDLRVVIIKLCDRLHNMSTLDSLPDGKQGRIATETLEIYAPLANRLGLYSLKSQLEDFCLKHLHYETYQLIKTKIASKKAEREAYINEVLSIIRKELKEYGFKEFKVYGRPKHFYSIYKKIIERHLDFEDIHDLFAFRIIVPTVKDCYEALGVVHALWKPMPGRFKDYIAMPKANMYQSLHTTVIRPSGDPCEIQIRTSVMHETCEFGVAAHWAYKEKKDLNGSQSLNHFSWLRQFMEWQSEIKDPNEFLESVKVDLFEEEIFVFTPKGDVIQLPANATALDFAFGVHTELGLKTVGAKINGRLVPIKHGLKNGDIIEIISSKNQKPGKDWLNFVKTSKAKNRIRSYLRSEQREESRNLGQVILETELHAKNLDLETLIKNGKIEILVKTARESNLDDVLVGIGYGKIAVHDLLTKAFPLIFQVIENKPETIEEKISRHSAGTTVKRSSSQKGLLVSGIKGMLVSVAKCCSPLPGEAVQGFITLGRGISVHRQDCPRTFALDPHRKIDVNWVSDENDVSSSHVVTISIVVHERAGVLADVTAAISSVGANIKSAKVSVSPHNEGLLSFEIAVKSKAQLDDVIKKILAVSDVIKASRKNS